MSLRSPTESWLSAFTARLREECFLWRRDMSGVSPRLIGGERQPGGGLLNRGGVSAVEGGGKFSSAGMAEPMAGGNETGSGVKWLLAGGKIAQSGEKFSRSGGKFSCDGVSDCQSGGSGVSCLRSEMEKLLSGVPFRGSDRAFRGSDRPGRGSDGWIVRSGARFRGSGWRKLGSCGVFRACGSDAVRSGVAVLPHPGLLPRCAKGDGSLARLVGKFARVFLLLILILVLLSVHRRAGEERD